MDTPTPAIIASGPQEAQQPHLATRLLRPLRPGVIAPDLDHGIVARVQRTIDNLPLLGRVLRYVERSEDADAAQVPIVYSRPAGLEGPAPSAHPTQGVVIATAPVSATSAAPSAVVQRARPRSALSAPPSSPGLQSLAATTPPTVAEQASGSSAAPRAVVVAKVARRAPLGPMGVGPGLPASSEVVQRAPLGPMGVGPGLPASGQLPAAAASARISSDGTPALMLKPAEPGPPATPQSDGMSSVMLKPAQPGRPAAPQLDLAPPARIVLPPGRRVHLGPMSVEPGMPASSDASSQPAARSGELPAVGPPARSTPDGLPALMLKPAEPGPSDAPQSDGTPALMLKPVQPSPPAAPQLDLALPARIVLPSGRRVHRGVSGDSLPDKAERAAGGTDSARLVQRTSADAGATPAGRREPPVGAQVSGTAPEGAQVGEMVAAAPGVPIQRRPEPSGEGTAARPAPTVAPAASVPRPTMLPSEPASVILAKLPLTPAAGPRIAMAREPARYAETARLVLPATSRHTVEASRDVPDTSVVRRAIDPASSMNAAIADGPTTTQIEPATQTNQHDDALDAGQVAEQVYDLLVRRLATEREQRGW